MGATLAAIRLSGESVMISLPSTGGFAELPDRRLGRNVRAGYQRGWGLQFGDLAKQVLNDQLYQDAVAVMDGRSIVAELHRINLYLILLFGMDGLRDGHIVEFGSFTGGNALFIAKVAKTLHPGMQVFAFDTFEGMPNTDPHRDLHSKGDFGDADYAGLVRARDRAGLDNLHLVSGLFQDTAPEALPKIKRISLNYIDCDIYSAVAYSYQASIPYMAEGGYWVFDDGLVSSCLGATEAIEEFLIKRDGRHSEQIFPHFVFRNHSAL
jgi:hypothetical protein